MSDRPYGARPNRDISRQTVGSPFSETKTLKTGHELSLLGMHSNDWSRLLTERQREVLSIVVENKVYRNRDSKISELAAQMGIAPAAVAKHLLEIEKTALLNVVVTPSEQGKRAYERMSLEPRPTRKQTSEVLEREKLGILEFLRHHPDASATEIAEELSLSEYTTVNSLRVLTAVQLVTKQRGPAMRRGVPPYVYRPTPHGRDLLDRFLIVPKA